MLAIQFQKRNPVNIRPLLGVKKDYNPKAIGLLLKAYSMLYRKTGEERFLDKANFLFNWLKDNYSRGYSGHCWGYNFPWAGPEKYLEANVPSAVVTGFVCRGIWEYHLVAHDEEPAKLIRSASNFVLNDLPRTEDQEGICFSYTPVIRDICLNASLLATEVLARAGCFGQPSAVSSQQSAVSGQQSTSEIRNQESLISLIASSIAFVINKQKPDGRWNYSIDPANGREREQIDFHQGYVIESLQEIAALSNLRSEACALAISRGLEFYRTKQFFPDGRSLWRLPKEYPVEIHNQSQGIITFSKMKEYGTDHLDFARKIADWTIRNMQDRKGYFHYQMHKTFKNRIPYMRWSNAWMLLALIHLTE